MTSSKTPKWMSASRPGARASISAIDRSHASRSNSGGGQGAVTKRPEPMRTPAASPA